MRVADRAVARNYLKYFHKTQTKYMETNQKIASGNRFTKLSDDVSAGARVLRSRMDRYKAEKQLENTKEANDELRIAEDAMTSINTLIMIIHEQKVVKAKNDPTSDEGRKIIAQEIRAMMDEIVQHANAKYGNKFSFGGTNGFVAPFSVDKNTGKLLYNGIDFDAMSVHPDSGKIVYDNGVDYEFEYEKDMDGNFILDAAGERIPMLDPVTNDPIHRYDDKGKLIPTTLVPMDKELYFDIDLGIKMNGPRIVSDTAFKVSYSGPEVFGFGVDEDGVSNNVYNVILEVMKNIDNYNLEELELWDNKLIKLMDVFRRNLTDVGVKTQYLWDTEKRLEDKIDQHTAKIYDLMGVDDAEEATNQMMNDYVLKAILQMGSRILPLSLMDFIR